MDFEAIELVSRAFEASLKSAFDASSIPNEVYVGPLDDPGAQGTSAVLFLYRVAVNADLRSAEHRVPAAIPSDPPDLFVGALPLDLYYLLTVPSQAGEEDQFRALRVLGCAMQALNDQPTLVGLPVRGETVRLSLDPISSEEMGRIWTLFPTVNFRTSVVYLASPVWIDPKLASVPGPPVLQERHRAGTLTPQRP
jgi:hypothetical protein